jgi:DNA-binding NarL/FixJ family response regulator
MPFKPISLAIVDDHVLFRKTLKSFLSEQPDLQVTAQASGILELLPRLRSSPIDVLLMDIFMPDGNGVDALRTIRAENAEIKILVVSMSTDMNLISEMLEAGIHGYISKADEPDDLLQAIKTASENRIFRNKHFTEALYWNSQNNIRTFTSSRRATLNDREKKILQLIWEEKSNKEIADELFLGVRSVEKIRQDIKEKLGVKSTVGLLKYAIDRKIIAVGPISSGLLS